MRHPLRYIFYYITLTILVSSCNDDVFISPMEITSDHDEISSGQSTVIRTNIYDVTEVWADFMLKTTDAAGNAHYKYLLSTDISSSTAEVENKAFSATMSFDRNKGRLNLAVDRNYYSDTIIANITFTSSISTLSKAIRIIPSSYLVPGPISYYTDTYVMTKTTSVKHGTTYINNMDKPWVITIVDETSIPALYRFSPLDQELNDALDRAEFEVPAVISTDQGVEVTDIPIKYTTYNTQLPGIGLPAEKYTLTLQPHESKTVKLWVEYECYEIPYSLQCTDSAEGTIIDIDGKYILQHPVSYQITIESTPDE